MLSSEKIANKTIDYNLIKTLDEKGLLKRNFDHPVLKETVIVRIENIFDILLIFF